MARPIYPTDTPLRGYDYWDEHPKFPLDEWKYKIANDDTRHGYWTWVKLQKEEGSA